jgi:hypothetical protein
VTRGFGCRGLGAGGTTMPLAASGHESTPDQELTLLVGLRALNVAMFASCFLVLWACAAKARLGPAPARPAEIRGVLCTRPDSRH